MVSDASIDTKDLRVSVQANGFIRRADTGYLIAKLCDGVAYDSLPDEASDARSEDAEFDQMLNTVDAWIETRGEMQREIDRLKGELVEMGKDPLVTRMIGPGIPEARDRMGIGERARQAERQRITDILRGLKIREHAIYYVPLNDAIAAIEETTP